MGSVLRGLNSKQLALCPSRLRAIGPKSTTMKPLLSQVRPPPSGPVRCHSQLERSTHCLTHTRWLSPRPHDGARKLRESARSPIAFWLLREVAAIDHCSIKTGGESVVLGCNDLTVLCRAMELNNDFAI